MKVANTLWQKDINANLEARKTAISALFIVIVMNAGKKVERSERKA